MSSTGETRHPWDLDVVQPQSFDIVIKVAERCNLACSYCYYYMQEFSGNNYTPFITEEVMAEVPQFLLRSAQELNLGRFRIVFHGGEPLLLKKNRFDQFCHSLAATLEGHAQVDFAVQTNGTLVDAEWIDLFERHKVALGVSIDGTPDQHDLRRKDHHGRGSYQATVRGLQLLQQAEQDGRIPSVGAICVVNPVEDSAKVLHHCVQDLRIHDTNLNFPRGGWDSPEVLRWDQAVESHRSIVRYTLDNLVHPEFHYVRSISDVLLTLRSEKGARINDWRRSRRHHIATISSEGALLVDDNMLGLDSRFAGTGLTIFGTSLRDLLDSGLWRTLDAAIDQVPAECQTCKWYRSCRSGELYNRYAKRNGFHNHSAICETLKMVHSEVAEFLHRRTSLTAEDLESLLARPSTCTAKTTRAMVERPRAGSH